MAIEYGMFIVVGTDVTQQTLTLAGQTTGLTNAEGFASVHETLTRALARVGAAGWTLNAIYANTAQTHVLIFSKQQ